MNVKNDPRFVDLTGYSLSPRRIKGPEHRPNIFDVFCLYGYSLFPYAPIAVWILK